jgi:hypothetical protein
MFSLEFSDEKLKLITGPHIQHTFKVKLYFTIKLNLPAPLNSMTRIPSDKPLLHHARVRLFLGIILTDISQAWRHTLVIPILKRLRQKDHKFKVNQGSIARPCPTPPPNRDCRCI